MTGAPHVAGGPDSTINELGTLIGVPGLKLDGNGCCQLAFDGRWLVTLAHVPGAQRWLLSCPLTDGRQTVPHGSQTAMLRANFMGAGSGGGFLCIAPDGKPCLQFQLPLAETTGQHLLDQLEGLLNLAETWAERLHRGEPTSGETTAATHAGGERPPPWMLNRV
ncbi:type III secretion system chaperone [Propionivibrio soli]|uniref:type III secretion system chaperone n=1 Tax=Propionivibrio soli TaxID=2976531 RepID=UPI0021E76EED|nr:type III secretion system chaperone [Propionivibrio soli]